MKEKNEQLSAIIDNEVVDEQLLDELITNELQQAQFSRYHLIGDVMRDEVADQFLNIDISQQVMAEINKSPQIAQVSTLDTSVNKTETQNKNNVVSFVKRFSQYAIAASVAFFRFLLYFFSKYIVIIGVEGSRRASTISIRRGNPIVTFISLRPA